MILNFIFFMLGSLFGIFIMAVFQISSIEDEQITDVKPEYDHIDDTDIDQHIPRID